MKVIETELPGVLIIEPRVFGDARGYFMETWHEVRYASLGLRERFVQDNLSYSEKGVLRGLHYQHPNGQGKLVYVLQGEVFDVAVDIRVGSPTFCQWFGTILSSDSRRQMYIPPGFAHGFCVTSETVLFAYKCTDYYDPAAEGGVHWNDPEIDITWPIAAPTLSPKDDALPKLRNIDPKRLPKFGSGLLGVRS